MAHAALKGHAALADGRGLDLAIGAAWLVGLGAALRVVDVIVGQSPLAAAVVGAVLVDLLLSRAGVRWDEAGGRPLEGYLRSAVVGAGFGALAVAVPVVLLTLAGAAHVAPGRPSFALALGLVRAGAVAVRDELLFRGLVLAVVARAGLPVAAGLGFSAVAGGAAVALERGSSPASVALVVASGLLFAVLWRRDRGAFQAVGAHAAVALLAGVGLRGGLIEVTWASGLLGAGTHAQGAPAWVAAIGCLAIALVVGRSVGVRRGETSGEASSDRGGAT